MYVIKKGRKFMYNENNPINYRKQRAYLLTEYSRPTMLFASEDMPWVFSKTVKGDSQVSLSQIIYAVSELRKVYSTKMIKDLLMRDKDFNALVQKDILERSYVLYSDYKKWTQNNKKLLRLELVKRKDLDLWLLGL